VVENRAEVVYWRHIGKRYAIDFDPWVHASSLVSACRWDSQDLPEDETTRMLVEHLDESNIKHEV